MGVEISADRAELLEHVLAGSIAVRETVFAELGVPVPPPQVRVNGALPPGQARVHLFEIPSPPVAIPSNSADGATLLLDQAIGLLRGRAADFLGVAETQRLVDELEQLSPALVRSVLPKAVPLPVLADVLRRLVDEGVSVRDLRAILEALALPPTGEKDLERSGRGTSART